MESERVRTCVESIAATLHAYRDGVGNIDGYDDCLKGLNIEQKAATRAALLQWETMPSNLKHVPSFQEVIWRITHDYAKSTELSFLHHDHEEVMYRVVNMSFHEIIRTYRDRLPRSMVCHSQKGKLKPTKAFCRAIFGVSRCKKNLITNMIPSVAETRWRIYCAVENLRERILAKNKLKLGRPVGHNGFVEADGKAWMKDCFRVEAKRADFFGKSIWLPMLHPGFSVGNQSKNDYDQKIPGTGDKETKHRHGTKQTVYEYSPEHYYNHDATEEIPLEEILSIDVSEYQDALDEYFKGGFMDTIIGKEYPDDVLQGIKEVDGEMPIVTITKVPIDEGMTTFVIRIENFVSRKFKSCYLESVNRSKHIDGEAIGSDVSDHRYVRIASRNPKHMFHLKSSNRPIASQPLNVEENDLLWMATSIMNVLDKVVLKYANGRRCPKYFTNQVQQLVGSVAGASYSNHSDYTPIYNRNYIATLQQPTPTEETAVKRQYKRVDRPTRGEMRVVTACFSDVDDVSEDESVVDLLLYDKRKKLVADVPTCGRTMHIQWFGNQFGSHTAKVSNNCPAAARVVASMRSSPDWGCDEIIELCNDHNLNLDNPIDSYSCRNVWTACVHREPGLVQKEKSTNPSSNLNRNSKGESDVAKPIADRIRLPSDTLKQAESDNIAKQLLAKKPEGFIRCPDPPWEFMNSHEIFLGLQKRKVECAVDIRRPVKRRKLNTDNEVVEKAEGGYICGNNNAWQTTPIQNLHLRSGRGCPSYKS